MSFAGEIRRAVMAAPRMKLPEIRPTLYKAFAAGQISEAEAEELDTLISGVSDPGPVPLPRWKDAAPGPPQADCRPHWQPGSPSQSRRSSPWSRSR
jgi:hypothetical protein